MKSKGLRRKIDNYMNHFFLIVCRVLDQACEIEGEHYFLAKT